MVHFQNIRIFTVLFFAIIFVSLVGCASSKTANCPAFEDEAVSVCRAEEVCRQKNTTYGVGLGVGAATDSSIIGSRTMATTDNYNTCIDQDLQLQRNRVQMQEQIKNVE